MNVYSKIFFSLIVILIFNKCNQPIVLKNKIDEQNGIFQFGSSSERNFFIHKNISDSLKLLWTNETYGSFSNSSFLIYDKYLFASDLSGRFFAFDRKNGKLIGYEKFNGDISVTPIVNSFKIFIPVNKIDSKEISIYTFDLLNGKILNELKFDGTIKDFLKIEDGLIAISTNGKLVKINYAGEILWEKKFPFEILSKAIIADNVCYFGNDKNELIEFDLTKKSIKKKIKLQSNISSGIAIDKNNLFFITEDGMLYSIDLINEKTNWQIKTKSKAVSFPVQNSKYVFIGNLSGEFYCVEKKSGNIQWKLFLNSLFNSTSLLFNNLIVIPDNNKKVYLVDITDGKILNTLNYDRRVKSTPIFYEDIIYFGCDRGEIYAYKILNN